MQATRLRDNSLLGCPTTTGRVEWRCEMFCRARQRQRPSQKRKNVKASGVWRLSNQNNEHDGDTEHTKTRYSSLLLVTTGGGLRVTAPAAPLLALAHSPESQETLTYGPVRRSVAGAGARRVRVRARGSRAAASAPMCMRALATSASGALSLRDAPTPLSTAPGSDRYATRQGSAVPRVRGRGGQHAGHTAERQQSLRMPDHDGPGGMECEMFCRARQRQRPSRTTPC